MCNERFGPNKKRRLLFFSNLFQEKLKLSNIYSNNKKYALLKHLMAQVSFLNKKNHNLHDTYCIHTLWHRCWKK